MNVGWLKIEDTDKIVELYSGDFADGWSKKMLEDAFLTGRFLALGVSDEKQLIGVITCSETLFDADI